LAPALSWQIMVLEDRETVPMPAIERFREVGSSQPKRREFDRVGRPRSVSTEFGNSLLPSKRIKAAISVKELVSQFVELSPSGTGICPFVRHVAA
jgi:hypothetical protein